MSPNVYILLTILGILTVFQIEVKETQFLRRDKSRILNSIVGLIMIEAIFAFLSIHLGELSPTFRGFHILAYALEYIFAPIVPLGFILLIDKHGVSKFEKALIIGILVVNTLFEVLSCIFPVVFFVDENNVSHRGDFEAIYIICYFISVVILMFHLWRFTVRSQNDTYYTLTALCVFLFIGYGMKVYVPQLITDWLITTLGFFIYIMYYCSIILKLDSLTNLLNKRCYENKLRDIEYNTCVIIIDCNRFKSINDTYGHQHGDSALKLIADCIMKVYSKYCFCFRIGGDEFAVIFKKGKLEQLAKHEKEFDWYANIEDLTVKLDETIANLSSEYPMLSNGVSQGFGFFYYSPSGLSNEYSEETVTIDEVVKIADSRMYEQKKIKHGLESQ